MYFAIVHQQLRKGVCVELSWIEWTNSKRHSVRCKTCLLLTTNMVIMTCHLAKDLGATTREDNPWLRGSTCIVRTFSLSLKTFPKTRCGPSRTYSLIDSTSRSWMLILAMGPKLQGIITARRLRPSLQNPNAYDRFVHNVEVREYIVQRLCLATTDYVDWFKNCHAQDWWSVGQHHENRTWVSCARGVACANDRKYFCNQQRIYQIFGKLWELSSKCQNCSKMICCTLVWNNVKWTCEASKFYRI